MRYLLLTICLFGALAASAQTTRSVQAAELWPELQGELSLKNGDYLLLALRGERSTDGYTGDNRLGFSARRVTVAYEHFWNEHWSWGATARYQSRNSLNFSSVDLLVPEILLRHRSVIFGGVTFGQRLSAERTFPLTQSYLGGSGPDGEFWGRLRVDAERLFPLSGGDAATGLALRPRLSYEVATHLRFQKETGDADERTIQFTSLRGEVGVRLARNVDVTPWFAYQTSYLQTLPQYDKNGVQTNGGKLNLVYPTVGLDVRFTLLPTGTEVGGQRLPTQH